jgi:hypothetical protein
MEDTLLLVLADHGVALGEHGYTGKPYGALWPELTDIPFFIRHPEGHGAGQTSDYYASTHDVAPTILGALGLQPLEQMDGEDLNVLLEYVWARDDRYVMFSVNDRSDPRLYDLRSDPDMDKNIAADNPDIVKRMFNKYILEDAGGPLPRF